jgi:hypothetical protein
MPSLESSLEGENAAALVQAGPGSVSLFAPECIRVRIAPPATKRMGSTGFQAKRAGPLARLR